MDEETFRAFYERTARGVWAYLARVTNDSQMADDLLQETFYRFLRAGKMHNSETHRRNSLYRIATNLARVRPPADIIWPVAAKGGDDIEELAARESSNHSDLRRALAVLNPRERAMLWLAYAEGASHREIAELLGLGEGSLKTLLFRARRKLAKLLGGTEVAK